MIEKIEVATDWVYEHKARFTACLGGLAVLGFGIGYKAPTAASKALEMVDNNLLEIE